VSPAGAAAAVLAASPYGGPPAGQWWPERALELARLARLR
jgi:hypothetical protein